MSARGGLSGKPQSTRQNVRVVCRVRPTNQKEISSGGVTCVKQNGTTNIEVNADGNQNSFSFDRIFGPDSSQIQVFQDSAYPLIADVLAGYNATIFAYGQTGTGKTHTMEGDITSQEGKGIIPRAVEALFEGVSQADENYEFTFKVSYVEIYLEKIRDLLDENRLKNNLTVREDKLKGVYIAGVTEEYVTTVQELLQIMHLGATNRATAATGMNEGSSRSHSVFTITVSQRHIINNSMKSGKLVLVDLAGSEMVRKTNSSGQQLEEAKMINKSLSALGQVINALTDEKATHVPYRDSKLTRVLQDSLGGNSKTVLIVAVSPSSYNASETVSTLRFGTRAKSIENKVSVNQTRSIEELENLLMRAEKAIDAQTAHIISLTTQLQAGGGRIEGGAGDAIRLEAEAAALKKLEDTVNSLTQELDDERQDSLRKDAELKEMANLLREKERLIQEAATLLGEVQRSNDGLKDRAEQLLKEKIEAVGEVESLRGSMSDEISKMKFEKMELELTIGTLQTENRQLKTEIAELSGDIADSVDERNIKQTKKNIVTSMSAVEDDDSVFRRGKRGQGDASTVGAPITIVTENGKVMNSAARKELIDQYNTQFAATCLKHGINEEISAELFGILDEFSNHYENGFGALEEKVTQLNKSHNKRIRELEDHRARLEKDLQSRIQNMVDLQLKFDLLSRLDNKQLNDTVAERERAKQKSLQQRLEQLVAVHRQLLRKFGSLELETAELKKKTALRDERIRQLENNSRGLIGNIRQQSERYLAELATLREQIQIMKAEAEHRVEISKALENPSNIISPMKGSNIARGAQPKSLRGGGGGAGIRAFFPGNDGISRSIDQNDKESNDAASIVSSSQMSKTNSFNGKVETNRDSPARNVFSRILGQK